MQLTFFTDYSLRVLMYLAAQNRLCKVREISDYYGISYNHLVKVTHGLARLGYISSVKGKGGGIKISKQAEKLKLGDLVQMLESNMDIVECFNRTTNTCNISSVCRLKHYLFDAKQAFLSSLNNHTLADAVNNKQLFIIESTANKT